MKVFAFGGRRGPFDYSSTVFALDTTTMSWWNPQVTPQKGEEAPMGQEGSACVFDARGGRMLFIGGWQVI